MADSAAPRRLFIPGLGGRAVADDSAAATAHGCSSALSGGPAARGDRRNFGNAGSNGEEPSPASTEVDARKSETLKDHLKAALDEPELTSLLRKNLGPEWQPFINEHNRLEGSRSVIFVRPQGNGLHMLIADYEHGELDLVRMELNGDALAKWMNHPQDQQAVSGSPLP